MSGINEALKGLSPLEVVFAFFVAGLIIAGILWLSVFIATWLVNYVLVYCGVAPVTKMFVFVCMILLSWVGRYFRSPKGRGE